MKKTISSYSIKSALLAAGMLLVFNTPAEAKVYRWIDDMGMVHYSDYRSAIPVQYRNQIKDKVKPPVSLFDGDAQQAKLTGSGKSGFEDKAKKEGDKKSGEKGEAGGDEPTLDPEVIRLLVETRDYLAYENAVYRRWMRAAKFNKEEGRFFVMLVHQYLPRKEDLIQKLEASEKAKALPVLDQVKFHLRDEAKVDKEMQVGGSDYIQRLEALERRLKGGLIEKDRLVENLSKALEQGKVKDQAIKTLQETISKEQEEARKNGLNSVKVDVVGDKKKQEKIPQPPPPGM